MKKLLVSLCAVAAIFASCSKEKDQSSNELKSVLLRINSVVPAPTLKSVEAPGVNTDGTIQLTDGIIFIAGPTGSITHKILLIVDQATTTAGQDLGAVPSNSSVLVVGNMGGSRADLMNCSTVAQVFAVTSNIQTQTDYKKVALSSGSAAVGTPVNGIARLSITLVPAISRLEIAQVKALTRAEELAKAKAAAALAGDPEPTTASYITGFKVAGVYVDRYYPQFTFGGANGGNYHQQNMSPDFTGVIPFMKDEGSWAATEAGTPPAFVAAHGSGNVWAYNVASGGVLARPIIKLTDITYIDAAGAAQAYPDTRYLTIGSYKQGSTTIDAFERGKIYRIGSANGISFSIEDTSANPNPDSEELYLHVGVTIQEWIIETPDGVLQ